jgi:uncharacterized protein YaaN involved in tellurite resistance
MRFGDSNDIKELQEIPMDTQLEIEEKFEMINEELKHSPEVIKIAKELNVSDLNTIMQFGHEPAVEVSKFADKILGSIKIYNVENSGDMLKELTKIMSRFDKEELTESPDGFFAKIFAGGKKTIEQLLSKYQSLGGEIDRIYSRISAYNSEIIKTNKALEEMFAQNFDYYKELEKYTAACGLIINEIESEDVPYWEQRAGFGYGDDNLKLQEVKAALEMLKQRLYDLEMAKMVSLQTAPQIRLIQKGNYKLIGKIQSAFIITIPIFKNGLIQAVTIKRQRIIAQSMEALDKATNELLIKNAENIKNQSIDIAKISGGEAIKVETLETAWKTIMEGIEETERIENENRKIRDEGANKINKIKSEILSK